VDKKWGRNPVKETASVPANRPGTVDSRIQSLEPFAKLFFCHPERNEGSQSPENTRSFAPLRMTKWLLAEASTSYKEKNPPGQPDCLSPQKEKTSTPLGGN
jgi:hypothetical protein